MEGRTPLKKNEDRYLFTPNGAMGRVHADSEKCICHNYGIMFLSTGEDNEHFKCVDMKIIHTQNHEGICCIDLQRLAGVYIHKLGAFFLSLICNKFDKELIKAYKSGPFAKKVHLYRMLIQRTDNTGLLGCRHLEDISLIPFLKDPDFSYNDIFHVLSVKIDTEGRSLCHNTDASMFCIHRLCNEKFDYSSHDYKERWSSFRLDFYELVFEYASKTEFNVHPIEMIKYYTEILEGVDKLRVCMSAEEKEDNTRMEMVDIYDELSTTTDIQDIIHVIVMVNQMMRDHLNGNDPEPLDPEELIWDCDIKQLNLLYFFLNLLVDSDDNDTKEDSDDNDTKEDSNDNDTKEDIFKGLKFIYEKDGDSDDDTKEDCFKGLKFNYELHDVSEVETIDVELGMYIVEKYSDRLYEMIWLSSKEVLKNNEKRGKTKGAHK